MAINQAIYILQNITANNLVDQNKLFMDYLQNGITVNYYQNDEQLTNIVYLVDYNNTNNNSFVIANQTPTAEPQQVKNPHQHRQLNQRSTIKKKQNYA